MSIYRFTAASPLSDVTFRYANDRPPAALIAAGPLADTAQLSTIRRAMEAHGWQAVPVFAEGRQLLQVSGFEQEGQLVALLMTQQFVKGIPQIEAEPGDHPSRSFKEWLEDNSIRAGGVLNLVGDGTLLASGLMSGRNKEAWAGALYTAGGAIAARYGNVRTEYHVRQVSAQLAEFLKQQAVDLPEDCGLYSILRDHRNGTLQTAEDLLYRYPSEATLGIYTLGAVSMLRSGLQHGKIMDTAYGVNSVATKAASLMIKEKPQDEIEQDKNTPHSPMGQVFEWVKEKPLRIFGYGSMLSDGLLGLSAYREYRTNPAQKSYIFKFLTTGTYLMADLMFAISSKNAANANGRFDMDEQRQIEALAAEAIAKQPQAFHAPLAQQVAGFLSIRPEMKGSAHDIAANIMQQTAAMQANPWAGRVAKGREVAQNALMYNPGLL